MRFREKCLHRSIGRGIDPTCIDIRYIQCLLKINLGCGFVVVGDSVVVTAVAISAIGAGSDNMVFWGLQ